MSSIIKNHLGGVAEERQKRTIKSSKRPYVTIIIPVFNEAARLKTGIATLLAYLKHVSYSYEIIVVDDGSEKQVKPRNLSRRRMHRIFVIRLSVNQGKGRAIAEGVRHARGRYVVFTDIDMSVHPTHIERMLALIRTHDIVIGSRRAIGSEIQVHQTWQREYAGRIFTFLASYLYRLNVSDVTCGFKGFQRSVAADIFSRLQTNRWVFDAEILYWARRYGYTISEMPVVWCDRSGSKVNTHDIIQSCIDILTLKWRIERKKRL